MAERAGGWALRARGLILSRARAWRARGQAALEAGWSVVVLDPKEAGEYAWLEAQSVPVATYLREQVSTLEHLDQVRRIRQAAIKDWQLPTAPSTGAVKLKQRLHRQHGTPRFDIVPPEWNKSVKEQPLLRHQWRQASDYSLSRADSGSRLLIHTNRSFTSKALFRLAVAQAKLKTLAGFTFRCHLSVPGCEGVGGARLGLLRGLRRCTGS